MTSYTETILELESFLDKYQKKLKVAESRIKWLEKGLKLIIKVANDNESGLVMVAQSTLDGESTTADEYNEEKK